MLPAFDVDIKLDLTPVKTAYTWCGAPIYAVRFTTTGTVSMPATIYTFPQPAVLSPDTRVSFRLIQVVGWGGLSNRHYYIGQGQSNVGAGSGPRGFQINSSGQLRINGSGSNYVGMQVIIYYAWVRV